MVEYLITHLWLIWTIVMFVCLILELSSGDFYVTCFAIGALCAALSTVLNVPFWGQVLVWAVCSMLSIWLIRPQLLRRLHGGHHERLSNADALIGRQGVVIEAIAPGRSGYVKVDGDAWKAVGTASDTIAEGEKVEIISRDSIIVTVVRI